MKRLLDVRCNKVKNVYTTFQHLNFFFFGGGVSVYNYLDIGTLFHLKLERI